MKKVLVCLALLGAQALASTLESEGSQEHLQDTTQMRAPKDVVMIQKRENVLYKYLVKSLCAELKREQLHSTVEIVFKSHTLPKNLIDETLEQFRKYTTIKISLMMVAAAVGDADLVERLMPYEAGLTNVFKETALMYAASGMHVGIVRMLVPHEYNGISHNMTALMRMAVMYITADDGRIGAYRDILSILAQYESSSVVTQPAEPNTCSRNKSTKGDALGRTALMLAAMLNNVEAVKVLAPHEIDCVSKEGKTALMYARENQCEQSIRILEDNEMVLRAK